MFSYTVNKLGAVTINIETTSSTGYFPKKTLQRFNPNFKSLECFFGHPVVLGTIINDILMWDCGYLLSLQSMSTSLAHDCIFSRQKSHHLDMSWRFSSHVVEQMLLQMLINVHNFDQLWSGCMLVTTWPQDKILGLN